MTDWPEVVRRHGPLVWRTAYRLLAHHADAADCFQRTFLAAVELARSEPVRNWPAALRRLATARALDQLRQRIRHRGRFDPSPDGRDEPGRSPDPVDAVSGGELAAALRRALADIDPRQAEVFCLVALDGLSYPEAGELLGLTANHVGVLLSRAKAGLREKLRAFDPTRQPGGTT
jgi:RNA polymerase sigma-70 factor (ECF subfamily)